MSPWSTAGRHRRPERKTLEAMRPPLAGIVAWLCIVAAPLPLFATEEYALKTGKPCGACHLNPAGGGELTPEGRVFQGELRGTAPAAPRSPVLVVLRLVAGSVHLFTAVLWFGTIFYVHLVLKPAYASRGLPRGEVRVGLVSMGVMAVTGVVLALFRVSSLEILLHTRFGILLTIKVSLFLLMVGSAMVAVFVIGPKLRAQGRPVGPEGRRDLTLAELSQFDGREGRRAYIAYQGQIYDVTKGRWWIEGMHAARHQAAGDLTSDLLQAPHGEENILRMPVIGRLVSPGRERKRPPQERAFYLMAYTNLSLAVAILLIVALWRWW